MAEPKKKRDLFDVVAVFVLSLTAVLTAWCGFQASKWGGDMSISFSQASSALSDKADAKFSAALASNQRGDDYTLLTVLFALVLFLTAMSQRELAAWVRTTLLGLAIVVAVGGVVMMLTFPILI